MASVTKAFNIIRLLQRSPSALTLTEIATSLEIAPSTVHSILNELVSQDALATGGDRRYRLGPSMFYYGASYARNAPIYDCAWRDLVKLSQEVSLTAILTVPWQEHRLILHVHGTGTSGLEVALGGRVPLDAGALGKSYFSLSGAQLPTELTAHTPRSITDLERYSKEVRRSRQLGYSVDLDEFIVGAGAIAAGVTGANGFEGVVALAGLVSEISEVIEVVGRLLANLAARSSYTLGDQSRIRVVGEE